MRTSIGVLAAIIVFGCALVVGPVSRAQAEARAEARAEESCTTQGALALALADVLGIKVTTAQAAADALAAIGIKPDAGWDIEACLTDAVVLEIRRSFVSHNRDEGDFNRTLNMVFRGPDREYPKPPPQVSPYK